MLIFYVYMSSNMSSIIQHISECDWETSQPHNLQFSIISDNIIIHTNVSGGSSINIT